MVFERVGLAGLNHLQQPRDAIERDVGRRLEHHRRRVVLRLDLVVRRRDETTRRVVFTRQVRAEAIPLVRAGARHRQPADPRAAGAVARRRLPVRRQRRRLPRDVAVDVAADQVFGRRLPVHRGVEELLAVLRLREPQPAQIRRRARLEQRRSQRVGAVARAVFVEDRTVPRELQLDLLRRSTFDRNLFGHDPHRLPLPAKSDFVRIGRIHLFDVHVFLIRADDRQAPRETIVVADRDADERRLAGADDVPARRVQVNDVAQRRVGDVAMRIVGDHRLAGARELAAHHPVVRPGFADAAEIVISDHRRAAGTEPASIRLDELRLRAAAAATATAAAATAAASRPATTTAGAPAATGRRD